MTASPPAVVLVLPSSSRDSKGPVDDEGERWGTPPAPTFHPELPCCTVPHENTRSTRPPTLKASTSASARRRGPVESRVPDVPKSTSGPDGVGRPGTTAKGLALRPQQPTQAAGPTEPPFIGDTYMRENVPPPTVSLTHSPLHCLLVWARLSVRTL